MWNSAATRVAWRAGGGELGCELGDDLANKHSQRARQLAAGQSRVDGKMAHLQTRAWSSQSLCWQNAPQYLASISIKISLFHRSCLLARKGAFLARLLPGEAATAASFPTRSPAVPTLPIFYSKLLYWIPRFVVVAILKGFKY